MRKYKHIITSGCSFSQRGGGSWPYALSDQLKIPVTVAGCPSAGNTWISKSAIYWAQKMINSGILPEELLVVVAWSGIDRKEIYVSDGTPNLDKETLLNYSEKVANPAHYIEESTGQYTLHYPGYLLGSLGCYFRNPAISNFKKELMGYYSNELLAMESFDNFLRLQWFCQSKGITLINHTFASLMYYPDGSWAPAPEKKLVKDRYKEVAALHEMIDWNTWIFSTDYGGMFDYAKEFKLSLMPDDAHLTQESHTKYVTDHLIPQARAKGFL